MAKILSFFIFGNVIFSEKFYWEFQIIETLILSLNQIKWMQFFETIFLEEVDEFMKTLDAKSQKKVVFNVRVAEQTNDPELFKKLNENIWEIEDSA